MSLNSYRNTIDRLSREKAGLEKDLAREREKIAKLQSEISTIRRNISSNTNLSTIQSKQRQLNSKSKDLAQCQKKVADLETKISTKIADINRNLQSLDKAEEQERTKQAAESKRRMNEELRHAQAVTREAKRQAQLYSELGSNRLVIDLARLPEGIKVLFVASNPLDQNQLRLDEEIRSIEKEIRASDGASPRRGRGVRGESPGNHWGFPHFQAAARGDNKGGGSAGNTAST
ncbi:hypothetical protein, partial [Archangium sp.]|uniref:hypothetical protein n=1 Tax=Archangium sp. TaxID=1872627 RepID=UPI002D23AA9E